MTSACSTITPRNASGCMQRQGDRCTLITKNRDVSYDDLGALVRACVESKS